MSENPFQFGNPVPPHLFVDHKRQLRTVVNRILNLGQSTAIVGEPRLGKTSLILYFSSRIYRSYLFGKDHVSFHFLHLDAQRLDCEITPNLFWRTILEPLGNHLIKLTKKPMLASAYMQCVEHDFENQLLGDLFSLLHENNHLAILIIDEFDSLLNCKNLLIPSFLGCLRSFASLSKGMSLIIASRLDLEALTQRTREIYAGGSPLTNIFAEVRMSCFSQSDSMVLLEKGNEYFSPKDRAFISKISGGHPYFLQAAAYFLWDAYNDETIPVETRWKYACEQLYPYVANTMKETWKLWSPSVKKVFIVISLNDIPQLIQKENFDINFLIDSLDDYEPELRILERQGFLKNTHGSESNAGYQVSAEAMLWWISDEIILSIRDGGDLGKWLIDQQWDGLLKKGEKNTATACGEFFGRMAKRRNRCFY